MVIPLLQRPIGVAVNCCEARPVPPTFTDLVFKPIITSPPVVLSDPAPAFCNRIITPLHHCWVEGPVAMNGNSPCGLHICNSLALNPPPNICGEAIFRSSCRAGVSASNQVQRVNISQAPEPPQNQVVGRAIPATGQAPGSVNVNVSGSSTGLIVGLFILVGFYFVTR